MIWSWSLYDQYAQCPRKVYSQKILKDFPDSTSTYGEWGHRAHKAFEIAVAYGGELETELQGLGWESKIGLLRSAPGEKLTELKLGVTSRLEPCGFFDNDKVWCRVVLDYVAIAGTKALLVDYKTGKRKLSNQLKLSALILFAHYPQLQEVVSGFMWLKEKGKIDSETYTRSQIKDLWKEFLPRLQQLQESFKTGLWPAKQNGLCRNYCSVRSCAYNGNYDPKLRKE